MFNTSPTSIRGRVAGFMTAPWLRRSNIVVAGGTGKYGGVAWRSMWRAQLHRRPAVLLTLAGMVLATASPLCAQVGTNWTGLNPFVTTNSVAATNKPVPAGGDGWEQPGTNGVTVKAGAKIWLAFLNIENPANSKFFRIEFYAGSHAEAENLKFLDCGGFNGSGNAVGATQTQTGKNSLNGEPRPGLIYQEFTFTPQPAWERISFINQNDHDIQLTDIKAWSVCASVRPILNKLTSSNTLFGADGPGVMRTNQRIQQVWVFPKTFPVNPGVQPQFVAPPATGPWNFQFVQTDPYGGTHPLGIKWITGGPGLAPDQAVDFSFAMQSPQADWGYTMYAFDGTTGQYQEYNLNLLPELNISGDINEVVLQFDSVAEMNHALETSVDLSNWQPFQSLPGTGQLITIPCTPTNAVQFFRFQVP